MTPLRNLLSNFSLGRWVLVGIGALLLLSLAFSGGSLWMKHRKDKAFDKERQAEVQYRESEIAKREEALTRANTALTEATNFAAKATIDQALADQQGRVAEQKRKDLENEDARYQEELLQADQPVDACTRIKRICERAKSLSLYAKDKECRCE